jgi:hypothetical protein
MLEFLALSLGMCQARYFAGRELLNRPDLGQGYEREFPNSGNVNAVTKLAIRKLLLTAV